jgi:hypothetical protein
MKCQFLFIVAIFFTLCLCLYVSELLKTTSVSCSILFFKMINFNFTSANVWNLILLEMNLKNLNSGQHTMESFRSRYVLQTHHFYISNFGLCYKVRFDPKIRGMVATAPIKKNEKLVSFWILSLSLSVFLSFSHSFSFSFSFSLLFFTFTFTFSSSHRFMFLFCLRWKFLQTSWSMTKWFFKTILNLNRYGTKQKNALQKIYSSSTTGNQHEDWHNRNYSC